MIRRATEVDASGGAQRERAGCRTARNANAVIIVLQAGVEIFDTDWHVSRNLLPDAAATNIDVFLSCVFLVFAKRQSDLN